jgi:hypothetical protein
LGYVAVPWRGDLSGVTRVEARFSDQIQLLGYKAPDVVMSGAPVDVALYWQALRPPEDSYIAFVHLVDLEGQWVAGQDGVPMNGRYPTPAWIPDEIVEDTHQVSTDRGIPGGTYVLSVGMYTWPGLERLPVWDREGTEQAGRALVLQSIELR